MARIANGTIGIVVIEPDRWCMPMIERACEIIGAHARRIEMNEATRRPGGFDALVLCSAVVDSGLIQTIAGGFHGPLLVITETVDAERRPSMDADRTRLIARPTRSIDLANELLHLLNASASATDSEPRR